MRQQRLDIAIKRGRQSCEYIGQPARPGGGNAHQRAIWNAQQLRSIQQNSHATPIYSNGISPEEVGSRENLASLLTGNDYTQYCAVARCEQKPGQCTIGDERNSWLPSNPTVAEVNAMGCICLQPYNSGSSPVQNPDAGRYDVIQLIADYFKRR